jgi:dCTP deaminase
MCILGRSELEKLIDGSRCIYPFSPELLDGDGYVLTVKEETTLQYLEHRNVTSHEIVFTPPAYVAHLTAKSKYGRMGLSFLNAAKVHSGFVGRLALELVNLHNERRPITIRKSDPLMHIEFMTRTGDPSPYAGTYMFQYMTEVEAQEYKRLMLSQYPQVFKEGQLQTWIEARVQE